MDLSMRIAMIRYLIAPIVYIQAATLAYAVSPMNFPKLEVIIGMCIAIHLGLLRQRLAAAPAVNLLQLIHTNPLSAQIASI